MDLSSKNKKTNSSSVDMKRNYHSQNKHTKYEHNDKRKMVNKSPVNIKESQTNDLKNKILGIHEHKKTYTEIQRERSSHSQNNKKINFLLGQNLLKKSEDNQHIIRNCISETENSDINIKNEQEKLSFLLETRKKMDNNFKDNDNSYQKFLYHKSVLARTNQIYNNSYIPNYDLMNNSYLYNKNSSSFGLDNSKNYEDSQEITNFKSELRPRSNNNKPEKLNNYKIEPREISTKLNKNPDPNQRLKSRSTDKLTKISENKNIDSKEKQIHDQMVKRHNQRNHVRDSHGVQTNKYKYDEKNKDSQDRKVGYKSNASPNLQIRNDNESQNSNKNLDKSKEKIDIKIRKISPIHSKNSHSPSPLRTSSIKNSQTNALTKDSKTSTNDSKWSNSNNREPDSIEEMHFLYVKFHHKSKKMLESQEIRKIKK